MKLRSKVLFLVMILLAIVGCSSNSTVSADLADLPANIVNPVDPPADASDPVDPPIDPVNPVEPVDPVDPVVLNYKNTLGYTEQTDSPEYLGFLDVIGAEVEISFADDNSMYYTDEEEVNLYLLQGGVACGVLSVNIDDAMFIAIKGSDFSEEEVDFPYEIKEYTTVVMTSSTEFSYSSSLNGEFQSSTERYLNSHIASIESDGVFCLKDAINSIRLDSLTINGGQGELVIRYIPE